MKKTIILFVCLILFIPAMPMFAFVSEKGFSYAPAFETGFGYGTSFGGLGVQLDLGYVIMDMGEFEGELLGGVGLRVLHVYNEETSYDGENAFYFMLHYGGIGYQEDSYIDGNGKYQYEKNVIVGTTLLIGHQNLFVLGKMNRFTLKYGVGVSYAKVKFFEGTPYEQNVTLTPFVFEIGISFLVYSNKHKKM